MPITELFLAALITTLITRLISPEMLSFARREGIQSQLNKWRHMLVKIQAVLADAEQRQIRDDSLVNLWLQDLRDLAYDVDDLLDGVAYDALTKIDTSPARGESTKVQKLVRCFGACNPCVVVSNARMELKIELINGRFQQIVSQQDLLHLSNKVSGTAWNSDDPRPMTSCVVDETAIFGRRNDKNAIIQLLTEGLDQAGLGVLPIVGMGGLGKTTLAQLVYNDNTVKGRFLTRAWACVSDQFEPERITRSILDSLKLTPHGTDLNSLQVQLKEALSGKRFLIILDDVWNEEYAAWDLLKAPFSSGLPGSMIIVTTQMKGVASTVGNIPPYDVNPLSNDACLSIFLCHALGDPSLQAPQNLAGIGIQIAKRCKGLPLAAKMLGGILRNKKKPEQWRDILESEIWDRPEGGILSALKLSYLHLPSHLKQCFAYCSLFPADYEFTKHDLILLWMAEGFLQPRSNQKKQLEELGSDYFDKLTSRSFFQPSSASSSAFVMHDLIHHLARSVASNAYINVGDHNATIQDITMRIRHSSFVRGEYDTFKRLEAFGDMNSLRTFLALPIERQPVMRSFLSHEALLNLVLKLKRLRVLCLCGYRIKELPDSVGKLKHLRYLNMTGTDIERLPESVTSLFNLLTLILRSCKYLKELPSSIGNLVNLRYLDLDDTPNLLRMPSGIKNLTSLQKLSKFVVGKNDELGMSDLKNFSSLQGKLLITELQNVVDISSPIHARLSGKDGLEVLHLEWRDKCDDTRDEEMERQVLHHLRPPKNLQKLEIFYYGGTQLPIWIGDPLCAPNLVWLRIDGCKNITSLPPLGRLPLLKELTLCGLVGVTSVGDELYGYDDPLFVGKAFPSLETLSISDMLGWKQWSCSGGLDLLCSLVLDNCPKLSGELPNHLPSLKELHIWDCPQLTGKLPNHLPSIEKLEIRDCPQLATTPSTTSSLASLSDLYLSRCVIAEDSPRVHVSWLTKLCIANVSDLCSLNMLNGLLCLCELRIRRCPRLVSFEEVTLPSTLKGLQVWRCEALETLPPMHNECFLDTLSIKGCNSLEYFPVVKKAKSSELFCWRAKILSIDNNSKLSRDIMVHGVESLKIRNCPSLKFFPTKGKKLPSSLKSLYIEYCENLHTLTEGMLMQDRNTTLSLEEIYIYDCPSLKRVSTVGKLPPSLKQLTLRYCSKLGAIPEALPGSSLEKINIHNCPNLQELPESLVQDNILSLKKVIMSDCQNLRSLPSQINSLSSLVELSINKCPVVRWSNIPQGGGLAFPFNITSLTIRKTLLLDQDMCKWGLDCLTSLRSLGIDGEGMDDVVSFPGYDDGKCFFLPVSIVFLTVVDFKNLESLSGGLQELSSLQALSIYDCPKLRYLSPKGLPSTVEFLSIFGSPVLGRCCKKDGGDYWPIISKIPCVNIDNQVQ